MASIFSKIIEGSIPSYKVYENDLVFVFLDIFPLRLGHCLIVPKIEVDFFADVPEPYYTEVFLVAKLLAPAIQNATNCGRVCTVVAGFDIPHFHYHLIPTDSAKDIDFSSPKPRATDEDLKQMQKNILSFLSI